MRREGVKVMERKLLLLLLLLLGKRMEEVVVPIRILGAMCMSIIISFMVGCRGRGVGGRGLGEGEVRCLGLG